MKRLCLLYAFLALIALAPALPAQDTRIYDIVISGGRVMDPESGFDRTANVGIEHGRIAAISPQPLRGEREIDASGRIVAPGFIDILSAPEGFTLEGNRYKVLDGVTSALLMHGGPIHPAAWYDSLAMQGRMVNFGTTVSHDSIRRVLGVDRNDAVRGAQLDSMVDLARGAILEGAVGIGFGVQYTPGASEEEILELFQVAADFKVPCHLHIRYLGPQPPENDLKAIQEVITAAAATGASAQIVHINSVAGHSMDVALQMIEGARARGIDVTADAYPWEAGSTRLQSALFDPGWQQRLMISYGDLALVSTGERLTEESFREYREQDELVWVIAYFVPKAGNIKAFRSPVVMVGSDGGIADGRGHPRGAGTYARFLRQYVREEGHLDLMEALRKTSYLPAQRLVGAAPIMRRKGRLARGADADIVVFDLNNVRERATYADPARYSEGFEYVLVNGTPVVERGELNLDARPGRAIRGAP